MATFLMFIITTQSYLPYTPYLTYLSYTMV